MDSLEAMSYTPAGVNVSSDTDQKILRPQKYWRMSNLPSCGYLLHDLTGRPESIIFEEADRSSDARLRYLIVYKLGPLTWRYLALKNRWYILRQHNNPPSLDFAMAWSVLGMLLARTLLTRPNNHRSLHHELAIYAPWNYSLNCWRYHPFPFV